MPSLATWALQNVPDVDAVDASMAKDAERHLRFLEVAGQRTPVALPKQLEPVALKKIDNATPNQLHEAWGYLKLPDKPERPKKKADFPQETVDKMRDAVRGAIATKALETDLATRMIKSWITHFKGNQETMAGQKTEDWVREHVLTEVLPNQEFIDFSSKSKLYPFGLVPSVSDTGCVAPSYDSFCIASTDGFFVSKASPSAPDIPWVLEVKLKASDRTIAHANEVKENRFFRIDRDSSLETLKEMARSVTDPDFTLQVLHHCASTGIPRALVVITTGKPGHASILRYVAVRFEAELLALHRRCIDFFSRTTMPFLHRDTTRHWGGVPPEHLNFLRNLRAVCVKEKMVTKEKSILPLVVETYNSEKRDVDLLHRQMGTVPSSNTGASRKLAFACLSMLALSARQAHRATQLVGQMQDMYCRDQITRKLNDVGSDDEMMYQIARGFRPEDFGLHELGSAAVSETPVAVSPVANDRWKPDDLAFQKLVTDKRNTATASSSDGSDGSNNDNSGLHTTVHAFFEDDDLNALRMNMHPIFNHAVGKWEKQKRCVLRTM